MRNNLLAVTTACILGVTSALATAASAQAQDTSRYAAPGDHFYQEPAEAPQGLRFANLEEAMGTDPLTWSSDPGWQLHRTPANQLAEAAATLQSALPEGTSAQDAAALLHKAGARCGSATAVQLVCGYHDAQTPYGGQYFDNVQWRVWLDLADGRVSHLTVTRDWTRH
jgi:hypothetical protein